MNHRMDPVNFESCCAGLECSVPALHIAACTHQISKRALHVAINQLQYLDMCSMDQMTSLTMW
jgi:hypothetical protein